MRQLVAQNRALRTLLNVAGQAIMVAAIVFLVIRLMQNWNEIAADVERLTAVPLVVAGLLVLAMLLLMPVGWALGLNAVGANLSWRLSFSIYYQVSILHYLPGTIWYLPGRAVLCQRQGIALSTFTKSIFLEMFFLLAAGGVFAGRGIAVYTEQPVLLALSALAAGAAAVMILWPGWVLSAGGRWPAAEKVERGRLLWMFLVYLVIWFVYGGAIAVLLQPLARTTVPALLDTVAINTAAWLVGFLSLAPTGMGVRELSLATLLGSAAGTMGIVASLCERVMELGLELALWLVARRMR